jgi:hypothetical protein
MLTDMVNYQGFNTINLQFLATDTAVIWRGGGRPLDEIGLWRTGVKAHDTCLWARLDGLISMGFQLAATQ